VAFLCTDQTCQGPTNWALLDPANALCAAGQNQSPINLVEGAFEIVPAADVAFELPNLTEGAEFENIGTTVEVVAPGGALNFDGIDYTMQQFHFHLPSEHLDGSASQAMEMHMVFESGAGQVAVISAFIDVNDCQGAGEAAAPISNVTAPVAGGHGAVVAEPPAVVAPPAEHPAVVEAPPAAEHPAVVESPPAAAHPVVVEAPPAAEHPAAVQAPAAPVAVHPSPAVPILTHGRRSVVAKNERRATAKKQSQRRQALGVAEGQLFAVPAPLAVAAGQSVFIETVLASVNEIAVPGTRVLTQALDISEVQAVLAAGNFRT
jgi:hypothetical protein